ncbi:MAG: DNA repair protein RecN [Bacteroidales bacterium]|nr:DNA repair protein RecN [Bacteroidales bacterium]
MLRTLHIENYALIAKSDIVFEGGFVAITGETGAGKSILLGALGLLLGARADNGALYDMEKKCVIEATFDIGALDLQGFFEQNDWDYADTLLLRRELTPSGKNRAFVNDTPVALTALKDLGTRLVDIHSQHQTLTIANSDFQLGLLDGMPGKAEDGTEDGERARLAYGAAFHQYQAQKKRLEQLTEQDSKNKQDLDYNQFLYDELQKANLADGEQEQLEEEHELLSNTEEIKQVFEEVFALCDSDENGAYQALTAAKGQLAKIASCHKGIDELYNRMESSLIELRDILDETQRLNDRFDFSPQRHQEVEERLDLIYRLEKKHHVAAIADLLAIQDNLDKRLQSIGALDEEIRRTMEAVDKAFAEVQTLAERLTEIRERNARKIEMALMPTLTDLGMKEAQLRVKLEKASDYGPNGNDSVSFLFNANRGGQFRELSRVASGGEMSRLMLAIKSLVVQQKLLPTIIFDEIDSGVSGDTSVRVGCIMQQMASHMQVIAITHLPQIAARAAQHLFVYKNTEGERTESHIRLLSRQERLRQIAIMLSSDPPTEAALQTARELMGK